MTTTPHTVRLFTQDEQTITTDWEIFKQFGIFQPQNDPEDRPKEPVPLPEVSAATVNRIIEYCEQHRNDEPHTGDAPRQPTEWDKTFIASLGQEELFEVILAVNYLDIQPLLDIACKQVAHMIKSKSPDEIRTLFNIE
ncbi:unnamed protein product [Rhizoctonia solani]|uniref:E3 ubiquitin ligase complex SCF subunit n=1 Tax=Rhizoctonia solani TaxID=456999 RepID=A0A8H3I699_9AGAM|nr:unnamed protein product [Rhizoctonia solani]